MNRLRSTAASLTVQNHSSNPHWLTPPPGARESCGQAHFFAPQQYESNYRYPLVVWLHNDGCNQSQVADVLPEISLQNYVGVGARAPRAVDSMGHGFSWLESESGIAIAEQTVFDAIDTAQQRYSINESCIFLAGYQQGGTMAYRIALRHPNAFKGAVTIGGRFPTGSRPFANLTAARQLPLMMALGEDEQAYPTEDLCRDLRALHAARIGLYLRQYDVREPLQSEVLSDVNQWIMAQVTGNDTLESSALCDTVPVEFSAN